MPTILPPVRLCSATDYWTARGYSVSRQRCFSGMRRGKLCHYRPRPPLPRQGCRLRGVRSRVSAIRGQLTTRRRPLPTGLDGGRHDDEGRWRVHAQHPPPVTRVRAACSEPRSRGSLHKAPDPAAVLHQTAAWPLPRVDCVCCRVRLATKVVASAIDAANGGWEGERQRGSVGARASRRTINRHISKTETARAAATAAYSD